MSEKEEIEAAPEVFIYTPDDSPGFLIEATIGKYAVSFRCFECVGSELSPEPGLLYSKDTPNGCSGAVKDWREADVYLHGDIKWDGCSNWHFDVQDDCMIHFCSRGEGKRIGELFSQMYDIAADHLEDLGDYFS